MENKGFLPSRVQAGETVWVAAANTAQSRVDIVIDGFTPATHTLAYQFAASTPITVSAVTNGSTGWTLEVSATATLAWKPGTIRFAAYATAIVGARVFAVDAGTISVDASPLATSAWSAVVSACDAAMLTQAGTGEQSGSFSIDGISKSFTYRSAQDLITLRAYAQNMVEQETAGRMPRVIRSRFT
jgi:uncharacterized protein (UPF0264 family)